MVDRRGRDPSCKRTPVRLPCGHGMAEPTGALVRARATALRRAPHARLPGRLVPRRRRRCSRLVADPETLRGPGSVRGRGRSPRGPGSVRRAALPLQLQLPRRGLPPRGAGRGGRPAGPRGAGAHRSQRVLRGGALRRGGPGLGSPHPLRCRADPGRLRRPNPARPTPVGGIWWCWPATRRATPRSAGPQRGPDGGGEGRPPLVAGPGRPAVGDGPRPPGGADRLPQGHRAQGAGRPRSRRGPPGGPTAGRDLRPGRGAVELWDHGDPLDSARNDALAQVAVAEGSRWWPPTTCTMPSRPDGDWPPPWRRCGPGGRSTRSTGGCPRRPGPTCGRGPSSRAGSPGTRVWSSGRPSWAGSVRSTSRWSLPNCPPSRAPTGTPRCRGCGPSPSAGPPGATAPGGSGRPRRPGTRSTTSSTSSSSWGSPATS